MSKPSVAQWLERSAVDLFAAMTNYRYWDEWQSADTERSPVQIWAEGFFEFYYKSCFYYLVSCNFFLVYFIINSVLIRFRVIGMFEDYLPLSEEGLRKPIYDVTETEKNMMIMVEMPGVDKADIDLNVNDRNVEVRAKKKEESEKTGEDEYSYYSSVRQFYRNIPLPKVIDSSKAKAIFRNGVLTVEAPKTEDGSKKIEIEG